MTDAEGQRDLEALVRLALEEDVGTGDVTTQWTVPDDKRAEAVVVAKSPSVVAGTLPFATTFRLLDPSVVVEVLAEDGSAAAPGDVVLRLEGSARSLLTGERVALNFLGHLSGVATLTRTFVQALEGTSARVVDTRKTTPGWRRLEKAAVLAGGGANHRMGLYDMVLIKDNHIAAAGGIPAAVEAVRRRNVRGLLVEVEVSDMDTLEQALQGGVERILLDNMTPEQVAEAVGRVGEWDGSRPQLEASGNVNLDTIRAYGETGVDLISVGAVTHSAGSADFSMRMSG